MSRSVVTEAVFFAVLFLLRGALLLVAVPLSLLVWLVAIVVWSFSRWATGRTRPRLARMLTWADQFVVATLTRTVLRWGGQQERWPWDQDTGTDLDATLSGLL